MRISRPIKVGCDEEEEEGEDDDDDDDESKDLQQ